MRTVVVGASSGLGRCIAIGLGKRGASVALLARRKDRLVDAAKEAGPEAVAIACDVTEPASCRDAIEEAASRLGGIDSLVYAPGVGPLRRLVDVDADTWRRTFETNVTGAALVTAAALPHLTASGGAAAYLTTVSASLTPPVAGAGGLRREQGGARQAGRSLARRAPSGRLHAGDRRQLRRRRGALEDGVRAGWDPALAAELVPAWVARNYLTGRCSRSTSSCASSRPCCVAAPPRASPRSRSPRGRSPDQEAVRRELHLGHDSLVHPTYAEWGSIL